MLARRQRILSCPRNERHPTNDVPIVRHIHSVQADAQQAAQTRRIHHAWRTRSPPRRLAAAPANRNRRVGQASAAQPLALESSQPLPVATAQNGQLHWWAMTCRGHGANSDWQLVETPNGRQVSQRMSRKPLRRSPETARRAEPIAQAFRFDRQAVGHRVASPNRLIRTRLLVVVGCHEESLEGLRVRDLHP